VGGQLAPSRPKHTLAVGVAVGCGVGVGVGVGDGVAVGAGVGVGVEVGVGVGDGVAVGAAVGAVKVNVYDAASPLVSEALICNVPAEAVPL
jgi:hypothetical protein